jgi:hypothetical protein
MVRIVGNSVQLCNFANESRRRKFPSLFRAVPVGETQGLKPVVRIHTAGWLLEQSPVLALDTDTVCILRPLLTAGQDCTYVMKHAQKDAVK